jgi:hypothetical protein
VLIWLLMEGFGGLIAHKMKSMQSEVREMSGVQQRRSLHEIISRDGLEASNRSARHTRQSLNGRKPHLIHFASSRVRMAVSDFFNVQELIFPRTSCLVFASHWRFPLARCPRCSFAASGRKFNDHAHITRGATRSAEPFSSCSTRERNPVAD